MVENSCLGVGSGIIAVVDCCENVLCFSRRKPLESLHCHQLELERFSFVSVVVSRCL